MKLEDVEQLMTKISCPICTKGDFEVKLRCDLSYDRCHVTLHCRRCGHEYEAASLINPGKNAPVDE